MGPKAVGYILIVSGISLEEILHYTTPGNFHVNILYCKAKYSLAVS